eukprot:9461026-Pyramimonas_sp.AAC.1
MAASTSVTFVPAVSPLHAGAGDRAPSMRSAFFDPAEDAMHAHDVHQRDDTHSATRKVVQGPA